MVTEQLKDERFRLIRQRVEARRERLDEVEFSPEQQAIDYYAVFQGGIRTGEQQ